MNQIATYECGMCGVRVQDDREMPLYCAHCFDATNGSMKVRMTKVKAEEEDAK